MMRFSRTLNLLVFTPLVCTLTSCASSPSRIKWEGLRASTTFQKEKVIHKERMGDREVCWGLGLDEFLKSANTAPAPNCIFPSSKISAEDEGFILENMTLKQNLSQLKVLQVTQDGFVLTSPYYQYRQIIYVHKTDEAGIVDGAFLDPSHDWKMYEYSGPYTYSTLAGSKTVHSFRKIPKEKFDKAGSGLQVFEPFKEFFIYNRLWTWLEGEKK